MEGCLDGFFLDGTIKPLGKAVGLRYLGGAMLGVIDPGESEREVFKSQRFDTLGALSRGGQRMWFGIGGKSLRPTKPCLANGARRRGL